MPFNTRNLKPRIKAMFLFDYSSCINALKLLLMSNKNIITHNYGTRTSVIVFGASQPSFAQSNRTVWGHLGEVTLGAIDVGRFHHRSCIGNVLSVIVLARKFE